MSDIGVKCHGCGRVKTKNETTCWALEWRSKNKTDGDERHLIRAYFVPVLFPTRKEAEAYRDEHFGFIRHRRDLRQEPHGWRFPKAVRVKVGVV